MSITDAVRLRDRPRTPPEPALRPAAEPGCGAEISVWSRLFFDGKTLVLRSRGFFGERRETRYPLSGPQGISRALLVFPDAETAGREPGAGEVWLLDASGRPVGRLLPYQWIPAGAPWLNFEEAVHRSGISALFKACGIPVDRTRQDRADAPGEPWWRKLALLLSPGPTLPLWYQALRIALGAVWFLAFTVLYFSEASLPWLMLLAAVTAFLAPVARLTVRFVTALRNRSAARLDPPPLVEVTPCPGPPEDGGGGTVATRRFVARSVLRVFPGELSVVDPYGADVRRALSGPAGAVALVRMTGPDGKPVGVELRYASGVRAPIGAWADWFAGPGGEAAWDRFRRAVPLPCEERKVSAVALSYPDLTRGPGAAFPDPRAKEARHAAYFTRSIGAVNSTLVMMISSGFSIWWAPVVRIESAVAAWTSVLLGVAGLLLQFAPWCWHHLSSRLYFERPVFRKDQSP
ncbi:hypothetical protein ABZ114_10320 [Streptomyces albidoflavus]|uniref:hypothetical protein n=1 Tax=Streptomyces TaxID=1883 RepID=UPI00063EC6D0|nr:hypothetical protein [Streptomyces sp. KE1]KLJ00203.1 membrane protein [Streptomyces sp. KE1]